MSYYVITSDEDGIEIHAYKDRAELEVAVNALAFGMEPIYLRDLPPMERGHFSVDFDGVVVIRGDIVEPEPFTKVTQWKVP